MAGVVTIDSDAADDSNKMIIDSRSQTTKEGTEKGLEKGGDMIDGIPVVNPKDLEMERKMVVLSKNEKEFEKKVKKGRFPGKQETLLGYLRICPKETKQSDVLAKELNCFEDTSKGVTPNREDSLLATDKEDVLENRMSQGGFAEASKQLQTCMKHQDNSVENLGFAVLNRVPAEDLTPGVYADLMNVDLLPAEALKQSQAATKCQEKKASKPLKRKRATVDKSVMCNDKESLAKECRQELNELFEYYKEFSGQKLIFEESKISNNSLIACLVEESNLPFSKLVDEVYENLKGKEGVTLASVRSAVLSVGQRMMYGIANADADVLEDESQLCLWCWEVRDMKLLNRSYRGILNVRRIGRRKIHERISALSDTLSVLSAPEYRENYNNDLIKASAKLGKALNGEGIHSLVERLKKKSEAEIAANESRLKEKASIKEGERKMRYMEKENKRIERDIQKEKSQNEKALKRLQDEAEKEEKCREKEELELKKQLKKQQDEAEKDQKRREKEDAEMKKQLAIQKQASIMQRFLKSKSNNNQEVIMGKVPSMKEPMDGLACKEEVVVNATTSAMDCIFSQQGSLPNEDLRNLHVASWRTLSHCNRSCHWGVRRKPRTGLFSELKLQGASSEVGPLEKIDTPNKVVASYKMNNSGERSLDKLSDEAEDSSQSDVCIATPSIQIVHKKLLQFDKSHRPAYYGIWPKKSSIIGPRCPFNKDPDLDYDVDSDEEWEEDEPGESLSDCDKDNEDESLDEKISKVEDEDDIEDDFVVPDGYLSENEGVQVDGSADSIENEPSSLPYCFKSEDESEEIKVFLQQQKCLRNFTEQALRKGHPLVISNLRHESLKLLMSEDLDGTNKVEHICLQALSMQTCPGGPMIVISIDQSPSTDNNDMSQSQGDNNSTSTATVVTISDSDLSEFVWTIRSNPYGINKVVESLQPKFPNIAKCQLRNKIREISDFVDNRWQVKKEVLEKLGLSTSPETGRRRKGIATYFTKRCLPPEGKGIVSGASPQPCSKIKRLDDNEDHCSYIDIKY
ncbi:chromatin assembly factor 1 subunit FSM [Iris pallida]|uniref:Chromatin assembly factor 1 subunit FSM n=1 Tax=Iris pallida TaxID=29817 RepID=A0AAX6FMD9_IRIPA|nr:chromatin assembly factor 1 subunit FSM [Iris pallida]KAJ6817509.1 chromatin assembly factor 1 subunit FSM [Iris pallida]